MSAIFPRSLLLVATLLAAPAASLAQDAPAPSPSPDMPVMHCMYDGDTKLMPPTAALACASSAESQLTRHTLADLLKAGWRVSHYDTTVWHQQIRHYFILEAK